MKKPTGKGKVFHINGGGLSQVNAWKQGFNVSEGVPVVEFRPYKPPVHPQQARIDAYAAIPSRFA